MRLIDADEVKQRVADTYFDTLIPCVIRAVDDSPTVDAEPVRHGHWVSVPHKSARVCSVCEHDEPYKNAPDDADIFNYCPHCGAKMDEIME